MQLMLKVINLTLSLEGKRLPKLHHLLHVTNRSFSHLSKL